MAMTSDKPFQFGLAALFQAMTVAAIAIALWLWMPWQLIWIVMVLPTFIVGTMFLVFAAGVAACLMTGVVVLVQSLLKQGEWHRATPPRIRPSAVRTDRPL
jgi:hypothetical protein